MKAIIHRGDFRMICEVYTERGDIRFSGKTKGDEQPLTLTATGISTEGVLIVIKAAVLIYGEIAQEAYTEAMTRIPDTTPLSDLEEV